MKNAIDMLKESHVLIYMQKGERERERSQELEIRAHLLVLKQIKHIPRTAHKIGGKCLMIRGSDTNAYISRVFKIGI